jgi:membrane protein implicated in regulation of membrane protease activity
MSFFDLRLPLGWLFLTIGALLLVNGFRATPATDTQSLVININLIWGGVMVAFGLVCLWLARRYAKRMRAEQTAPTDSQKH